MTKRKNKIRNLLLAFSLCLLSFTGFSQLLSGDLLTDKRAIISNINPVIHSTHYTGKIVFKIAVNADGVITSAVEDEEKTTIKSTPAKIKAYNLLKNVKFAPGAYFPKYHSGLYQITFTK